MRYALGLVAAMLVVGCQAQRPVAKAPASEPTVLVLNSSGTYTGTTTLNAGYLTLEGMKPTPQVRKGWPVSVSPYPNGAVVAGPIYYTDAPRVGGKEWTSSVLQPFWFIGQTVILPVSLVIQPPWTAVPYRGEGLGQPSK